MTYRRVATALGLGAIAACVIACSGAGTTDTGMDPDVETQADRLEWLDKFSKVWTDYDKKVTVRKAEWDMLDIRNQFVLCLTVVQVAHHTPRNAQVSQSLKVYDEKNVLLTTWHGAMSPRMAKSGMMSPWEAAEK